MVLKRLRYGRYSERGMTYGFHEGYCEKMWGLHCYGEQSAE